MCQKQQQKQQQQQRQQHSVLLQQPQQQEYDACTGLNGSRPQLALVQHTRFVHIYHRIVVGKVQSFCFEDKPV